MKNADLDKRHVWHPFTPLDAWFDPEFEPVMIASGKGSELIDEQGRVYLDGNSSIWTNIHGHAHPKLNAGIKAQLDKISHSSYLGLGHAPGAQLAEKLAALMPQRPMRVFYSDNGSTAMEVAAKIAFQYFAQNGQPQRRNFLSLTSGYHGDTVGAMSLGHSKAFHGMYAPLLFSVHEVMAPGCYRCPYNQAKPEKADARTYRKCSWECAGLVEKVLEEKGDTLAALVVEPRVQGAAGMLMHPEGYLKRVAELAKKHRVLLIVDEIMTGFGRTGAMLACEHEGVAPDIFALSKGLTGGYMPLAATLVAEEVVQGFRGGLERTLYHGHSYTGNQLGCATALTSLEILEEEKTLERVAKLSKVLRTLSSRFWKHPNVGDVRQEGLILAVELVEDRDSRKPFPWERRLAYHICERARKLGLLTRGIGSVLILMPPFSTTEEQLAKMVEALDRALWEELP